MSPPLGDVDAVETEIVRPAGEPQDDIGSRLKWCESHADMTGRLMLLTRAPLMGSPRKCVVLMRVQAIVPLAS